MDWEKIKKDICVEIFAIDEEGTKVIIRETVEDKGVHETYMNIYNKLTNMYKTTKWEIQYIYTRGTNSTYCNKTREEEA